MNRFILLFSIGLATLLLIPLQAQVQDTVAMKAGHEAAQASFEKIVGRFADFFQTKQKMIYKYAHPKSASGFAARLIEYTCREVQYGVNNTNFAPVPYKAQITLNFSVKTNQKCGKVTDVAAFGLPAGWDNEADALANNSSACFRSNRKPQIQQVRLDFEFRKKSGQWVFLKAVNIAKNSDDPALSAALGVIIKPALTLEEQAAQSFNGKWRQLVP